MVSFIIDESHLRQLSAGARSELLQIIGAELADLKIDFADQEWDPEGNQSYPLSADEARVLIRGLGRKIHPRLPPDRLLYRLIQS